MNANQEDADACHIGYMYEYVKESLIASGVISGVLIVLAWCGGISYFTKADWCMKISIILMVGSVVGAFIAMIVLMGKIWNSNPEETIPFYEVFWKTPVECPSTIDSKWYEWTQVPVKYDAFSMMIGFVTLGLAGCCFGCGLVGAECCTHIEDEV